jgi:hypothetical protein
MEFDEYEKDLLIETIENRLENDESLIYSQSLKEDLNDLLRKLEEDE